MTIFKHAWTERGLKYRVRPGANRFLHPDWRRFWQPGHESDPFYRFFERLERRDWHTQPRVPAGEPTGGQWTDDESASSSQGRTYAAGWLPKIPKQRPPTSSERTAIAKTVAILAAEAGVAATGIGEAIAKTSWVYYALPSIVSYLDAPKTLDELQADAAIPKPGYDRHHIVEQTSAAEDGWPRKMIDAPDNLVSVPRMKHWEINAWYQTPNRIYDGLPPREYLRGKDWDERRNVGLDALRQFGVLSQ
jgi:hypothetical protein